MSWQDELARKKGLLPKSGGSPAPFQVVRGTNLTMVLKAVEAITGCAGVTELAFAKSMKRRWRWDAAWPTVKVALEVQGGGWIQGRGAHGRPTKARIDEEKRQAGEDLGWKLLYCDPQAVKDLSIVHRLVVAIDKRGIGGEHDSR